MSDEPRSTPAAPYGGVLKLREHRALKPTILTRLGHINVICGPNNSGKTTVLEAIANHELCSAAIEIDEQERLRAFNIGLGRPPDLYNSPPGWHLDQYSRAFALFNSLADRNDRYLGRHDIAAFTNAINFDSQVEPDLEARLDGNRVGDYLMSRIADHEFPKRTLIPPKRQFVNPITFNVRAPVSSDGGHLVLDLFHSQNDKPSSPARQLFDEVQRIFQEISGYRFGLFVISGSTDVELMFERPGYEYLKARDCGLGLQDLLVIIRHCVDNDVRMLLIEEPENHLHPTFQRRLLAYLLSIKDKVFFLSTHSNVFLDSTYVDRIFLTHFDESVVITDETRRSVLLNDLGYSIADNLAPDAIVLVEGPTDIPVYKEFLVKLGAIPKYQISIRPLGGDIMDKIDLDDFKQGAPILAIVDNDPGSSVTRTRFVRACEKHEIPVTRLSRYAIENYFTPAALRRVNKGWVSEDIETFAPDRTLKEQLGWDVKASNWKIVKEMSIDDIQGTDLLAFLEQVLATCQR